MRATLYRPLHEALISTENHVTRKSDWSVVLCDATIQKLEKTVRKRKVIKKLNH
jgi:hypothetical protein